MATCTTMTAREPFPRTPTPRPSSTFPILTKRMSYQSLRSPVLTSPIGGMPFVNDFGSQDSPGWEHINVISPSTASHHSLYSDGEDHAFQSPRLALLTSNILGGHVHDTSDELNMLISPSAPVKLPGDELLYDVDSEARPDACFFHPSFQAGLNATKQEMKDISLAIWGCPASHQLGSDLHALKEWAKQLSEFEPSRSKTIGLIGDSGVGKSSVINSLLDQPYLASSSASLSTPIITEYRYRPAHDNEPFAIEVDYMTSDEIKELIEELLRSFRACYIPSFQDVDSPEERREIRVRSEVAWCTLQSMFRDQPIFTKELLLEYPTEADIPLLNILEKWASDSLARRPGGPDCPTWSSTGFTIDECTDKLEAFTADPVGDNVCALWPYVQVVRVYLRAAILRSGLVLVDCPALRNLNLARARATERYLRRCHEVFAVTTMENALSDAGVQDIIKRNSRHRPLRIICTKSEDINPRTVERNESDVSLQVRTWRQQIDALQKQAKRCEAQRRHGLPGALEEEVRSRDILQDMEFGLKKFLIERRNRQVATQLIDKYAADVQMGDLKVFCVSNHEYWEHRYDEQSRAESRLELSGIVNLRKYCHSIPAEAQFTAAVAFIEHDVPAFLGSLRQWAVGGTDEISKEKAEGIRHLMNELEEAAIKNLVLPSAQIQITKTNLNHEFASSIVLPIREHRSEWRNAALDASKEWSKWDANTYASFCRHHGTRTAVSTGSRNWNEELTYPMRLTLQSNWGFFQESVSDSRKELIDSIAAVFTNMTATLHPHIPDAPQALGNLVDNISARCGAMTQVVETGFDEILEGTAAVESDTLYGHATSYINTLMLPAYHACNAEPATPALSSAPGAEADQNRKHAITTHIASARIFPKLSTMIERHHRQFLHSAFDKMLVGVQKEVDAFVRDLGLVVSSSAEETESEASRFPEFAVRLRERLDGAGDVVQRVREVLGEVKREMRERE